MKIKLLTCIAFLGLMSCSGDDNSNPVNPGPSEKQLKKISEYDMENGYVISEKIFENDFLKHRYAYTSNGAELFHNVYSYNEQGLMTTLEAYNGDFLDAKETITYNEQQKITHVLREFFSEDGTVYVIHKDYVYNADNTITNEVYDDEQSATVIYYLNNAGLVYKTELDRAISDYIKIEELDFDDNNNVIAWRSKKQDKITFEYTLIGEEFFTYDVDTPVLGSYLNQHRFGDFITNGFLYYTFHSRIIFQENFLSGGVQSNGDVWERIYEYDQEGYPVKSETYINNSLKWKEIIEYQ